MRRHLAAQARTGRSGVAAIGVAQEFQNVFAAARRKGRTGSRGSPSPRPTGSAGGVGELARGEAGLTPEASREVLWRGEPAEEGDARHRGDALADQGACMLYPTVRQVLSGGLP